MITQSMAMLLAFSLGFLVTTGLVKIWWIYAIAALRGTVMSFNMPARQSIIPELVLKDELPNAVALNSATMNLTRVMGPSLGGLLIAFFGIDWLFYINGLSFLAIIETLRRITGLPKKTRKPRGNPFQDLAEGVLFLGKNRLLLYLVFLALVPMFFGQPYLTMLTVFAHDVLKVGPAGLGFLTSIASIGAISGALFVDVSKLAPKISFMLKGLIFFGGSLFLFAFTTYLPLSAFFLFLAGAGNVTYNSTNNTLLQMNIPDSYRGRILSFLFINRGMVPLGTALAGFLAEHFSAPIALGIMAITLIFFAVVASFFKPR